MPRVAASATPILNDIASRVPPDRGSAARGVPAPGVPLGTCSPEGGQLTARKEPRSEERTPIQEQLPNPSVRGSTSHAAATAHPEAAAGEQQDYDDDE